LQFDKLTLLSPRAIQQENITVKTSASKTVLYGLAKCGTCVKALDWLGRRGIAHEFIDYRDHPVPPATLAAWAGQAGGWEKLVNRASMTWRALPEARRAASSEAQWLALIAGYPALVRRPVAVTPDGEIMVGFSEKRYAERFAG
jgi:Spx/MgsR family transcriptional regulator